MNENDKSSVLQVSQIGECTFNIPETGWDAKYFQDGTCESYCRDRGEGDK